MAYTEPAMETLTTLQGFNTGSRNTKSFFNAFCQLVLKLCNRQSIIWPEPSLESLITLADSNIRFLLDEMDAEILTMCLNVINELLKEPGIKEELFDSLSDFYSASGLCVLDGMNYNDTPNISNYINVYWLCGLISMVSSKSETASKCFNRGLEFIQENNQEEVENESYISAAFLNNLGCMVFMQRKYEEAVKIFEKCLKQRLPLNVVRKVRNNIAHTCMKLGEYDVAVSIYESILENRVTRLSDSSEQCNPNFEVKGERSCHDSLLPIPLQDEEVLHEPTKSTRGDVHTEITISVNIARLYNSLGNYEKALELMEEISYHKKSFLLTSPVMSLIVASEHIEVLAMMGYTSKTNQAIFSGYLHEISLHMSVLNELKFRPSYLLCARNVGHALCSIGERNTAREFLSEALECSKALYGLDSMLTQSVVDTLEKLFPAKQEEIQETVSFKELRECPINNIAAVYQNCSKGTPNGIDPKENLGMIMETEDDNPHDFLKKALCTNVAMITRGDLLPEEENMILRFWNETGVLQPQPFYLTYFIASLSFLLEGLLIIESLTTVIPVCEALMNAVAYVKNLDLYKCSSHFEMYKNFDGLLSSFVSTTEAVVSDSSINVCTIVTSGRQPSTYDESVKKPLFNCNALGNVQKIVVVVLRCTELKDIQELREIHELNVKSVHSLGKPPQSILIVAPSCLYSLSTTRKPNLFSFGCFLFAILSENGDETENQRLYLHEYKKELTFALKSEPGVLSAALHHSFKIQVLAEEVYKSGDDQMTISFTNRNHGLLNLVAEDNQLSLILSTLLPSPSDVDVIPNHITDICDDVIRKCSDHFQVRPLSQTPWLLVVDGNEDFINQATRRKSSEVSLLKKLKSQRQNSYISYLENKVQDLTRLCKGRENNVPQLELPVSQSVNDTRITATSELDGPSHGATWSESEDLSLCSNDNEQTRSLSLEFEIRDDERTFTNNEKHLREIGEAEFRRESAERKFYKHVGLQQDVQSFKRRSSSQQILSTSGAIGVQGATNKFEESLSSKDSGVAMSSRDSVESSAGPEIITVTGNFSQFDDNQLTVLHFDENPRGGEETGIQSNSTTSNERYHSDLGQNDILQSQRAKYKEGNRGVNTLAEGNKPGISFNKETFKDTKTKKPCSSEQTDSCSDESAIVERGALFEVTADGTHDVKIQNINHSSDNESSLESFQSATESLTGDVGASPKHKGPSVSNETDSELVKTTEDISTDLRKDMLLLLKSFTPTLDLAPSFTPKAKKQERNNDERCVEQKRAGCGRILSSKLRKTETVVADGPSSTHSQEFHYVDPCLSMKKKCVDIYSTGSQDELMKHSESIVSDGCLVQNAQAECGKSYFIQMFSEVDLQTSESTFSLEEERNANSKRIVILGHPGTGKSLLCQKLVRDVTQGYLQFSSLSTNVKFAFLVPFHQLNIFGRNNCTLRELLNHFSLPGNNSVIDKSRFEQIVEQQQQVLLVFDGYDAYSYREDILDNVFEQQYTNDPHIDMPPPIIISKILRQKILSRAHVVITSRPDEAKELRRINITDSKEISGLSYTEMKNFIEESFQSKASNQGISMVPRLSGKEREPGLADVITHWSLPPQQHAANPVDHKMQERYFLYQTLFDKEPGQQGENQKQRRNRVVSEGDDKQPYSRLRDYFNMFPDAPTDEKTVSSDPYSMGARSSFLGKHSNDSRIQNIGSPLSPFMSMPTLNDPRSARTNNPMLKEYVAGEFQSKRNERNLTECLNTSKDLCDGTQDQLRGNYQGNNQSSKNFSLESQLSDLRNFEDSLNTEYAEECENKSSLHIAKDIREKQSDMHSAINLATTLQSCEQYEEAISYGRKCLDIAQELNDKSMEMRALLNIATTYQNLERYEDAIALNLKCQELSEEMGSGEMEARAVINLSMIYQATHRFNDAVELSKKCIQLSEASGDKSMVMKAARDIGMIYQTMSKYNDSIRYYQMCLEISCETADKEIEMHVSRNLAVIHQHLNQVHEAISYYKRSFEISKELEDKDIEMSTAKDLASIYMSLNQLGDAVAYNQRCLQIAQEKGEKQMQIEIAENLVKAFKVLNEHENAVFYYKILFQIAKEQDDKEMEMQTSREIAILYQGMSQKEVDAILNNERCLKIAVELGDKKMEMDVTSDLTNTFKKMNQIGHAIEHCERCFEIANQLGDKKMAMCRAVDLGEFYKISEQYNDAIVYYKRALAIAEEIGDREKEIQANREMAVMYKALNKPFDALDCFTKSLKIAKEIGDREQEIQATREMAVIYKSLNKPKDALHYLKKSLKIAEEIGDKRTEMTTIREMAGISITLHDAAQALSYNDRSLKISREIGERAIEMEISQELAALSKDMDQLEDAISYHERSLKIAKELSDRQSEMNICMNLVTLYKALHKYDKAIEPARAYWSMARQMNDSNVEIKACLLLISLYEFQGIYDEVFLFSRRGLEIAKENGDKKAEVIICLAVGEACHSLEQVKAQPQWENVSKDIEAKVASIRKAMKLKTLNRGSYRSKGAMNVAASYGTSNPPEGETSSGAYSQSHTDKGDRDLSRGIIEVVMGMEVPMTLNEAYNSLTNNHITPSEEKKCIHLAKEIWAAFEGFNARSHVTPQAQGSNARTSFRDRSSEGKNPNKSSKTKTSIYQSSGSDGTTTNGHPSAPGGDFGPKGSLLKGSSSYKDNSSFDSSNTTSSDSQTLNITCTRSENETPSDNVTSSEFGNQTADMTSLPVCNVVSSHSDNADTSSSECALRSLEESVGMARETMGSLMTQSMYDMDHRLRENRRRERELRRRIEQEEIDRMIAAKKAKELEKHDNSLQPASLPVQVDDDDLVSCTHFKRGCDMFFPCCEAFYQCHRCHNQSDACDVNDSKAADATRLRCRTCRTDQEITPQGSHCIHCKRKLSEYFCGICKHYTADDKQPYHCDPCGICRIHKDNSFHCDVCNVCLNKRLRGRHKCRPNSGHDECCICLEDAFSGCQVLPCSHKVHRECAVQMIRNGVRTCPICRAPIYE